MIYKRLSAETPSTEETGISKRDDMESRAFGITIPLLLTSTGEKFGKSAGNAVWLDESMTSVFDFYQFLMKTTDADVGKYLEMFTFLKQEQVAEIMAQHTKSPEQRLAQTTLANETTELVHGGKVRIFWRAFRFTKENLK